MGIKESIADVTAEASDLALAVGKWAVGTFTSAGVTFTGTSAFTVLMGYVVITAAAATGLVYIGTTASATAIMAVNGTSTRTCFSIAGSAVNTGGALMTASNSTVTEFAAGASVKVCAQATAGKYGIFYIATPS